VGVVGVLTHWEGTPTTNAGQKCVARQGFDSLESIVSVIFAIAE